MATNKPEVVAWRWRKPVVNGQGEAVGATAWKLSDTPGFLPWWTNEPLIRLSDYERLQSECEKLRAEYEEETFCLRQDRDTHFGELMRALEQVEKLQAESLEMVQVLADSRANDRQAMYYLNQVREIVGGDDFSDMVEKVKELKSELDAHRASRIAYASEFPLGADGTPDVGSIHENIRLLKKDAEFGRSVLAKREPGKAYGCHCDLEEDMEPDGCVIDEGNRLDCVYARRIETKEQCEYWRVIASDAAHHKGEKS